MDGVDFDESQGQIVEHKVKSKYLFVLLNDGSFKQFHIGRHQCLYHYHNCDWDVSVSNAITSDRKYIFTACEGDSIKQFNIDTHQMVREYKNISDNFGKIAISNNGK